MNLNVSDPRQQHMTSLAAQIKACRACEGMNVPGVTQAAPGYGSVRSPVVIAGLHSSAQQPC
jgi:DNA polymerase